jgi:hypothetical protein
MTDGTAARTPVFTDRIVARSSLETWIRQLPASRINPSGDCHAGKLPRSLFARPLAAIAVSAMVLASDNEAICAPPSIRADIRALANGLSDFFLHLDARKLRDGRNMHAFVEYMHTQAVSHGAELFVIDSAGHLLIATRKTSAPGYERPSPDVIQRAAAGQMVVFAKAREHLVYALAKLDHISDTYLLVVRPT